MPDNFKIFETNSYLEDLKDDFSGQRGKILKKLTGYVYPQLRQNPYFGKNIKKLVNYNPETWRYRIGDYRFFYIINDRKNIVIMISADNRSRSY